MAANPVVPTPELSFETSGNRVETVVRCTGKITSATSELFQSTVKRLIPTTKKVVLDLTHVSHMDSSGLGALVGVWISAKRAGCELRLINLSQRLKGLLRITNLAKVFEGHEDYLGMTPD